VPPTVTVIIPTYNRARYLPDCINSVLTQSTPVDEILIVDDGSTDGTAELVSSWGDRVTYLFQSNAGAAAARNLGLQVATGDFIAFQDSDDIWLPDKNALQLEFFRRYPDVDIVFGLMANFRGEQDEPIAEIGNTAVYAALKATNTNVEDMFSLLLTYNMVPTPTVMCRRTCVEKAGMFDVGLRIAEDFEYWLRISSLCRFGFIDRVLLKRRRHDSNLIDERHIRLHCQIGILQNMAAQYPHLTPAQRATVTRQLSDLHYDLGSLYLRWGRFAASLDHLKQCDRRRHPLLPLHLKLLVASSLGPLQGTPS
jgi:glycosyltransferase involved in cell wall biosynthesis